MVRRILAAALVAFVTCAAPALATVKKARVKFGIPDAPYALLVPGQPWQGELTVQAPGGADIADFEFEGEGWQVEPMRTGDRRAALAAGEKVTLPLRIVRANPARPLRVLYTAGGEAYEQAVNLRGLTRERRRVRPLRPATPLDLAKVAPVPGADAMKLAPMPHDRRSRDAEGLLRGAVGGERLSDSDVSGAWRATQPSGAQGTQARSIRVFGSIVGQGPVTNFGADGVYFAVYDEDSGIDELLAEGTTNANGQYDVTINWDPCVFCDSNPDLYVYFETENSHVFTQSPVLEWEYSWETGITADYTGTSLNMGAFMPGDQESDGVLYVHTAITRMWRWFDDQGWNVPTVDVQCWDDDADPVSYYTSIGEIHMSPSRMFNTSSISHEYHHHWMEEFSSNPNPDYCNGTCDNNGDCGHCRWCQEPGYVVWSEGMPEFGERLVFNMFQAQYPSFTNDLRDVEPVDSCTTAVDDGHKTEGLFAAAVYDLVDSNNENDSVIPGLSADVLDFDDKLPYQIFDQVAPTTVTAFFNEVNSRVPGQKQAIWSTAMNGGVNLDTAAPGAVTGLISNDHNVGIWSGDATIKMSWNAASDDWSGAFQYSVAYTASPALPDTFPEVTNALTHTSAFLAPGTYYACVRAKDRFGRWSGTYASAGPYLLKAPDPADIEPAQPAGWAKPVVPNALSSMTTNNVTAPTFLGGASNVRWNAAGLNSGQSFSGSTQVVALVDGDSADVVTIASVAPGANWYVNNETYLVVRGGRHTLGAYGDGLEVVAETDETDNIWAKQWTWSSLFVSANVLQNRAAAPLRTGGHADIGAGEAIYTNSDGLRFQSTGQWNALWAYATDFDDDTDLRLHFPSSHVDTGFTATIATSARVGGYLDALVVNQNTVGQVNWDAGVVNWNGGASNYRAKHVTSQTFVFGDSIEVGFPADEMMRLHEVNVALANLGDVVVTLRTAPGSPPVHLRWLDRTYRYGGITTYTAGATTDSTGLARIIVNLSVSADYGVMCYRDPKDGAGALPFSLQIERAPADLATFAPAGWYSPVVPRPATDGTFSSVPMPDTLRSTPSPTYFNMGAKNIGTIAAPPTSSWMLVDGVLAATYGYPTWNAGAQMLFNSTYAVYIRGGRHTLSHILDGNDLVEELVTSNNQYGEQYVWGPPGLATDAPLTRTAPPDRTAGWSDVTVPVTLYFNSDGFRTPDAPPAGGANTWSAVAVLPGASSDVDLRMHELSPGTKNGFRNPVATSVWATGMSDYVLANFNSTGYRRFDVGAVRWNGTESYTVMATTSQRRTIGANGVVGTFTQGASDLLDLHEVWLEPGLWGITLETLSGGANLGLALHGTAALQGKSSALGTAWYEPAGLLENVVVNVVTPGWHCIAVWKTGSADLAQTATYRLVAATGTLDAGDPLPAAVALGSPWPNPASGATSVWFALPSAGPVELEVFDVSGARVRTLARGEHAAGRHTVAWDGRTDAGGRAPAGLYYLRFHGGGATESRKIVRVE